MPPPDLSRDHPDPLADGPSPPALPPLVLDRQRVVSSAAFRRLQHKTQVFVAPDSDHFRSRLTHTLEVANHARCLAARLGLREDLAEVVALAHDLGHPPFGHAGERALAECLRDHGGFEHNRHSLRIVEELEHPYPEFRGLNLTRAVRECLAKHSSPYDHPGSHPLQDRRPPPPEGEVVDLADRLTYALHDTLDALYAGLIDLEALADLPLWRRCYHGPPTGESSAWRGHLRGAADRIQAFVLDSVRCEPDAGGRPRVVLPDFVEAELSDLDRLLRRRVYGSPKLVAADERGQVVLREVFAALLDRPAELPPRFQARLRQAPAARVVCDYVAGMTDRFCLSEHDRLLGRRPAALPETPSGRDA